MCGGRYRKTTDPCFTAGSQTDWNEDGVGDVYLTPAGRCEGVGIEKHLIVFDDTARNQTPDRIEDGVGSDVYLLADRCAEVGIEKHPTQVDHTARNQTDWVEDGIGDVYLLAEDRCGNT